MAQDVHSMCANYRYHTDPDYRTYVKSMAAMRKKSMRSDPEQAELLRAREREYSKRHYYNNPDYREKQRQRALCRYYQNKQVVRVAQQASMAW
jgi:hypothetical protein